MPPLLPVTTPMRWRSRRSSAARPIADRTRSGRRDESRKVVGMNRMIDNCHSVGDLRQRARRRLPAPIFDVMEGGAETEVTARRNTDAFDDLNLIPRCLVDVEHVKTSTTILGQDVRWPVYCSPTGGSRYFHPEGELAVARAAAKAGTLYGLSTTSTYSIEQVAAASDGPKLFQLYMCKDRGLTRSLISRAKRS